MAYITLDDIKQYLQIQEGSDNALLQQGIDAAQAFIDTYCNGVFEAETATKYFDRSALDWDNSSIIHLGNQDLQTITELLNGDSSSTEIVVASYWLLDRNDGPPYHAIQLTNASGVVWEWDTDGWVTITGTWGRFASAPADIVQAMKRLAAMHYRGKDSQIFETTAIPEAGIITMPIGTPNDVRAIIENHNRYF